MFHASAIAESIVAPTLFRPEFSHSLDPLRTFYWIVRFSRGCTKNQWFPFPAVSPGFGRILAVTGPETRKCGLVAEFRYQLAVKTGRPTKFGQSDVVEKTYVCAAIFRG